MSQHTHKPPHHHGEHGHRKDDEDPIPTALDYDPNIPDDGGDSGGHGGSQPPPPPKK